MPMGIDDVLAGRQHWAIVHADVREGLKQLPDNSVHTICTSAPYGGLRAYGTDPQDWADGWRGELGAEPDPFRYVTPPEWTTEEEAQYVAAMRVRLLGPGS
jgi:DNA modification methylase